MVNETLQDTVARLSAVPDDASEVRMDGDTFRAVLAWLRVLELDRAQWVDVERLR